MCGITGYLDLNKSGNAAEMTARVVRMTDTIRHRGPDDDGVWVDPETGAALGFRRLSIIDLSPAGHQPMVSADGRYVIIFNGETYNFGEIRPELEARGVVFRGTSDTEVMVEAICAWGIEAALKRFNGMLGLTVWDRRERTLTLARDRLGIKPLYYGWMGNTFLFGSELKPMRAHPAFQGEIDRDVMALYLRHNYIPAPFSIYKGIRKLTPGCSLQIRLDDPHSDPAPQPYWSAREAAERGAANPLRVSDNEAIGELDALLRDGIEKRMIADVPLGAFLSGGIDSSNVVAIMQQISSRPVKTFSIGFNEDDYNEARYAKEVARHLGTDHTELYVTPEEAQAVIPRLPTLYDEPFADSSQIPTFLVSELARRHVTVSLSGDGGDELFSGYNRYFWGRRIWRTVGWVPGPVRSSIFRPLSGVRPAQWQRFFNAFGPLLPRGFHQPQFTDKMQKLMETLAVGSPEDLYFQLISLWKNPVSIVLNATEPATALTDPAQWPDLPDFTRWMMYMDLVTYLPDDILTKVDRASMGVSLEARVPYLDDYRVAEFAWRTPLSMKIRGGQGKWLLRQVLHQYVPRELIERPKMGFGVPIDSWMRGPLKDWAGDLLSEERLRREGYFDPAPIRQKWTEHLEGKRNWQYYLWGVLMFQAWLEETHG
jgi:asparagine synthase (glutamine-hydrolysing)